MEIGRAREDLARELEEHLVSVQDTKRLDMLRPGLGNMPLGAAEEVEAAEEALVDLSGLVPRLDLECQTSLRLLHPPLQKKLNI